MANLAVVTLAEHAGLHDLTPMSSIPVLVVSNEYLLCG